MRNYETIFIMDPSLSDDKATEEIDKVRSVVESASGEIMSVQKWGKRKLAYEINKRREGIYALIKFRGDGTAVSELERNFRIREAIIRFMTVVDENPPSEAEAEQAESAPAGGAAAASPEGATPPGTAEAAPTAGAEGSGEKIAPEAAPSDEPPAGQGEGSTTTG